jgi:hypothetical protein
VSGDPSEPLPSPDALDDWDVTADERERLADERERLADERETLADQREYLADEQERLLDARFDAWHREHDEVDGVGDETIEREARATLERAEARVERAVAERDRARSAVERARRAAERGTADGERREQLRRASELDETERSWSLERRAFVAGERARLADARDRSDDGRDELADRRERDADRRDLSDSKRARTLERSQQSDPSSSARGGADLSTVRDAAHRQRQQAARARERARTDRVDARSHAPLAPWSSESYGPGLAAQFALLTRELFSSRDLTQTIERVETFALDAIPGCVAAGVAITGGGQPALHVTTDAIAQRLDALQFASSTGPAVDALELQEPVDVRDLAEDGPPPLSDAARDLGISGTVAFALSVPRADGWQSLGVLTLYAGEPEAFDDDAGELGGILAAYLSVAAGLDRDRTDLTRRAAALHRALGTRDVIGQAKGILMERRHIPAGEAFDILRRTSQRLNVRLHEVAAQLAETGELPGDEAS